MIVMKWSVRRADPDTIEALVFLGEEGRTLQNAGTLRFRIGEYQITGATLLAGKQITGRDFRFIVEGESEALDR